MSVFQFHLFQRNFYIWLCENGWWRQVVNKGQTLANQSKSQFSLKKTQNKTPNPMLYTLLLKYFFQRGGRRRKKEESKLLGCCICHPRLQHNPCQSILSLVTWTVRSSSLLSCKPTNKKLVPQVTVMTRQSSENTQLKQPVRDVPA